jgi:hypothetical protein
MRVASACARGPGLRRSGRGRLRRCSVLPANKREAAACTPDAALELLLSQPATGKLLTLVLEWATQEALQARARGHPTSNLTQHLYAHLGCALRSHSLWVFSRLTCLHACLASEELLDGGEGTVPALLLRPLCSPHSALDYRQLVEAAIRLLRARLAWRRMAMRQLRVCVCPLLPSPCDVCVTLMRARRCASHGVAPLLTSARRT